VSDAPWGLVLSDALQRVVELCSIAVFIVALAAMTDSGCWMLGGWLRQALASAEMSASAAVLDADQAGSLACISWPVVSGELFDQVLTVCMCGLVSSVGSLVGSVCSEVCGRMVVGGG
jgi:hypothetical protein